MRPFTLDCLKEKPLIAQPVEAFDAVCHVAEMSAEEQDKRLSIPWLSRKSRLGQAEDDNTGFRSFIVAASLCNEKREFTAATTADINELADKIGAANSREVTKLAFVASQLNGLGDVVAEEIKKN